MSDDYITTGVNVFLKDVYHFNLPANSQNVEVEVTFPTTINNDCAYIFMNERWINITPENPIIHLGMRETVLVNVDLAVHFSNEVIVRFTAGETIANT